jgi:uncharacterized repeat protein (TIGR03803 family)
MTQDFRIATSLRTAWVATTLCCIAVVLSQSPVAHGDYSILASFNGANGANPQGGLTLDGSTLYGMTQNGGSSGHGNIFSINTDGTGFQNLLSFNGANGANPYGSLTLSGSTLYGMTPFGGSSGNNGIVFSINTNGTSFQNLFSFDGPNGGYSGPTSSLTLRNYLKS